jgi:hypothetical protein
VPNCDFYALQDDAVDLLEYVFTETDCAVYELSSRPGEQLRQFRAAGEVLAAFELGVGRAAVHLQLYSPSMGGSYRIRRIDFDPSRVKGPAWRLEGHGWGAIQLYLGGLHAGRILPSHTNHNSEKRARKWEPLLGRELGSVDAWNWPEVVRISRALNRRISSRALGKHGSRPILRAAWAALQSVTVKCG